ncbi:MAG: phosphotransferase [Clostridia bacterium]|nr:phosphotransferase [Clostridia bacterium]
MDTGIREDLEKTFGMKILRSEEIAGGWLNRKWKIITADGIFLVKQFSRKRFGDRQLLQIRDALVRQTAVRGDGVPCPAILYADGQPMRFLDDDAKNVYMVMTFCEGHMEMPETVTAEQMYSLGETCGKMHHAFRRFSPDGVKGYPIDGKRLLDELRENFRVRRNDPSPSPEYHAAVAAQEKILDSLDHSFFERLPKGIAHEDFSPDNLLFDAHGVTAVLDFDRCCYSFRYHDIGRALMSLAWNRGSLDPEKTLAFLNGYAAFLPVTPADVPDILRITWCIEAPWWIRPEFFSDCSPKVARFRDEILFLTDNWFSPDAFILR